MGTRADGLKARVARVLEQSDKPLTMGEVLTVAGFAKTDAPEVSSALYSCAIKERCARCEARAQAPEGPRLCGGTCGSAGHRKARLGLC